MSLPSNLADLTEHYLHALEYRADMEACDAEERGLHLWLAEQEYRAEQEQEHHETALEQLAAKQRRATPPPSVIPACKHCTNCEHNKPRYHWQQRRDGGWHIRVNCQCCERFLTFAPQVEPYLTFANATASETAVLDVLVQCEERGIKLRSDGQVASFGDGDDDRDQDTRRLRELVRQCSHDLASLLGRR